MDSSDTAHFAGIASLPKNRAAGDLVLRAGRERHGAGALGPSAVADDDDDEPAFNLLYGRSAAATRPWDHPPAHCRLIGHLEGARSVPLATAAATQSVTMLASHSTSVARKPSMGVVSLPGGVRR